MTQAGTALARVVIVTPNGQLDLALPEQLPVVSLLPGVLRHAGDSPALDGSAGGGWALRRSDGSNLDLSRSLAAQQVRDGEVLHLVARRAEWPELSYDDIVHAIATGSTRRGGAWSPAATRLTGLILGAAVLFVGLYVVATAGDPWWFGGAAALVTSVVLLVTGLVLSRAMSNSVAAAMVGSAGLPYAFLGGVYVLADDGADLAIGAPHLLLGSTALLLAGFIGYLSVADGGRVFVAAIVAGLYGALGGALTISWLRPEEAAAVVVSLVTLLLPAMPLLAVRLGKIPMPALPRQTADLLNDDPQPTREVVYRATARADEMLTGIVFGSVVVALICEVVLALAGTVASVLLAGIVSGSLLLRARLLVTIRHRVPLLIGGFVSFALALVLVLGGLPNVAWVAVMLPLLLLVAALVSAAGVTYSRRRPSPRLARYADFLDVFLQLAVVPVACSVLGLYSFMRALNG